MSSTESRTSRRASPRIEYRHRVLSTEYRVLTEYREPSLSIEYHHRVSSTITEYRSMEYRHRVEYQVPSAHRVSSTITEYRVPSPSIKYHHRVSKYGVPSPCRVPSTECSPSIEYR